MAMALAEQARDAALRVHDYREAIRDQYNAWSYLMCSRADHPDEVDRVAERLAELESRTRERRGQPLLPDGHTTLTPYYYLRGQWDQPGTRPPEVKLAGWEAAASPQPLPLHAHPYLPGRWGLGRGPTVA